MRERNLFCRPSLNLIGCQYDPYPKLSTHLCTEYGSDTISVVGPEYGVIDNLPDPHNAGLRTGLPAKLAQHARTEHQGFR
jgi:hypothetical protein